MNITELELFEKWQTDISFINWSTNANTVDVAKWDDYFKANPQYAEIADLAKFSVLQLQAVPKEIGKQKGVDALAKLNKKIESQPSPSYSPIGLFKFSNAWKIAAAILFIVGFSLWFYSSPTDTREEIVWHSELEKQEIRLIDGTKVTLNKASTLRYFDKDVRNVRLEGEAYFEVTKNPSQAPFTVTTNDLVVKVLGTEFNVNTNKEQTSVFLDEGKVQLALESSKTASLEMQPGDLVSFSKKQDKVLENKQADALENTAWKEEVIWLDGSTLDEVLQVVSKVHGVKFKKIVVTESDQLFAGGLPTQDLSIALRAIELAFQLKIQKKEGQYLIENK